MLLKIFPEAWQSYLSLPILGSTIEEFTSWANERGHTIKTIRYLLKGVKKIDVFFVQQNITSIDELTHEHFELAWQHYYSIRNTRNTVHTIKQFINETYGLAPSPKIIKTPILEELDFYVGYLKDVRGFAERTIKSHAIYIRDFLQYLDYDNNTPILQSLTLKQIEEFVCVCSKRMNRYSLQHLIGYIRSFLRFKYEQGALNIPLHTMIDSPRVYRLEQLPRSIPWETVNKLILSIEQKDAIDIRDYTILYLTASYGLRACETASLTLDDICWKEGLIKIPQSKSKKTLYLPLTDAVGEVLIRYLKKARRDVPHRNLFFLSHAPYNPLTRTAISEIFKRRVRASGLNIKHGIHSLRHAYAEHLLRQGTSIKAIGDLLGHRSQESTCVYLRLAIEDLRSVGLQVPQTPKIEIPKNLILEHYKTHKTMPNANQSNNITHLKKDYSASSFLAKSIEDYIRLKRSLGRDYRGESHTLYVFDSFLALHYPYAKNLTPKMFDNWCSTLHHLSSTVCRRRMYIVHNLCVFHSRSHPQTFVPDVLNFPKNHQSVVPYIFSELEIAQLITAAQHLLPHKSRNFPLRSATLGLAILLLYTTGIRRGELLRLCLADFNQQEMTLQIRETKFHKSRIVPISSTVAIELRKYLHLRSIGNFPMEQKSPLIWNGKVNTNPQSYSGSGFITNFSALCKALRIFKEDGRTPRIHDVRHSFACRVLQHWYEQGENVQAKLPLLSTYMGHISIVSTHYYLQFIEEISSEVSMRFYKSFGQPLTSSTQKPRFAEKRDNT